MKFKVEIGSGKIPKSTVFFYWWKKRKVKDPHEEHPDLPSTIKFPSVLDDDFDLDDDAADHMDRHFENDYRD